MSLSDEELRRRLGSLAEEAEPRLESPARERVLDAVLERGPALVANGMDAEELRDRLQDLAEEGAPRLDDAARARILDRVELEGPALARRRRGGRVALLAIPLAAAAALVLWVAAASEPSAPRAARVCESWSPAEGIARDGRLALGQRGVATVEGDLSMRAPDGCMTELELASGRVSVHARDLGQGALRVRAGEVTVEVRGTRFTVVRAGDHVEVHVDEGHVVVRAPEEREIHLYAGERWTRGQRLAAGPLERSPVEPASDDEAASDEAVSDDEAASDEVASDTDDETATDEATATRIDEPTSVAARGRARPARETSTHGETDDPRALLATAEARWRAGEHERARGLFRRVGAGRGSLAEAAWIRLARLELRGGDPERAVRAVRAQRRRFPRSRFGAEALWIEADAERRRGHARAMEAALEQLRRLYPDSPQARAAASLEE
ncbi:MAG: FecR family protein [Sandaracinaceae bacterium]